MIPAVITVAAILLLAAIGSLILAIIAARRLVLPRKRPALPVLAYDETSITVPATSQTLQPGIFGLWTTPKRGHLVVSDVLEHNTISRTVRRRIIQSTGQPPHSGDSILWTSHVFPGPEALSSAAESLELNVDGGTAPAWLIPGSPGTTRWAIHVHGIRTTRITALRSVPAASAAGITSLVISYHGDGEAPTASNGASMLGSTEWRDLEPAIQFARKHGATDITLIAWSMGAEVAFCYLQNGQSRDLINALVLISPITSWNEALSNALRHAHLPTFIGRLADRILSTAHLHTLAGTPAPINLHELDWTHRIVSIPSLIVHSCHDKESPINASRTLANANRATVTLVESSVGGHALEYNAHPDWFTDTVAAWLRSLTRRRRL